MDAPPVEKTTVFRVDRIVAYYREFRISHMESEKGEWVYHILDPGYRKVKTVLSLQSAQMWIDEIMDAK